MYRVTLTKRAVREFRRARAWYKRNLGVTAALKFERSIKSAIERLRTSPPMIAARDDLPANVLRIVARQHILFFDIEGRDVRVLSIVHGARHGNGVAGRGIVRGAG